MEMDPKTSLAARALRKIRHPRTLHADRDAAAAAAEARVDDLAAGRTEGEVQPDRERVIVARGQLLLAEEDLLQGRASGREGELVPDPGVAAVDLEAQA